MRTAADVGIFHHPFEQMIYFGSEHYVRKERIGYDHTLSTSKDVQLHSRTRFLRGDLVWQYALSEIPRRHCTSARRQLYNAQLTLHLSEWKELCIPIMLAAARSTHAVRPH